MFRRLVAVLAFLAASTAAPAATVSFNDPGQSRQWYLDQLHFGQAWASITALPQRGRIHVAVVDSGFDVGHSDLQRNLALGKGINIVNGSANLKPVNPHGTGTIGLLAATSGNGEGITQAAWTAKAIPVRVSNQPDGSAFVRDLAKGIRYAADKGARVINVSYSGVHMGILQNAARYAQTKGAVVFMAAGNDGRMHPNWRNHKQLVAVGSTGRDGRVSGFSSRGGFVDLVAPGEDILSLTTRDRTRSWSGTSFSSPIAASVASLMLIANPKLSPWQVRNLLFRTAVDIGPAGLDDKSGFGLIDAQAAVAAAIDTRGKYRGNIAGRKISLVPNNLASHSGLTIVNQLQSVSGPDAESTAVPEPGSTAMVLLGFGLVSGRPSRRREGNT